MRRILKDQSGTMDLNSIIVGALITAFIIAAGIFTGQAMIPWQMDRNAREAISGIGPAQQSSLSATGSYAALPDLVQARWLENEPQGVKMAMPADQSCWSAVSVSSTGTVFIAEKEGITQVGDRPYTSSCLDQAQMRTLVASAGGPTNWAKVTGLPAPPSSLDWNSVTETLSWQPSAGAEGFQVEAYCGSQLGRSPDFQDHFGYTARSAKITATGCTAGVPLVINIWATDSLDGEAQSRVGGISTLY